MEIQHFILYYEVSSVKILLEITMCKGRRRLRSVAKFEFELSSDFGHFRSFSKTRSAQESRSSNVTQNSWTLVELYYGVKNALARLIKSVSEKSKIKRERVNVFVEKF